MTDFSSQVHKVEELLRVLRGKKRLVVVDVKTLASQQ